MNNNVFFSIVVPAYNVEQHLKQTAESILNQTFKDFELIIVDDCSPDSTPQIADEIAAGNEKVKVIHLPENSGVSFTRNTGMAQAKGKYILFLDSDDTVDCTLLQEAYDEIVKHHPKVVVYGHIEEYYSDDGVLSYSKEISYPKTVCENAQQVRKEIINLEKETMLGYPWNKVYDLEYIKKIGLEFEKITLIEDILFNVNFVRDIDSMVILPGCTYHYAKRIDESLTNKFVKEYFDLHRQRVQMIYDMYESWGMLDDNVKTILANIYSRYIFSALQRNCDKRSGMNAKMRKKWMKNLLKDSLFVSLSPYMNKGQGLLKILNFFLTSKNVGLCLLLGKIIFSVKHASPVLFAKAKQSR